MILQAADLGCVWGGLTVSGKQVETRAGCLLSADTVLATLHKVLPCAERSKCLGQSAGTLGGFPWLPGGGE